MSGMDHEVRRNVEESLKRKHGDIVRLQTHDAPEWFGDGWLVSFEVRKQAGELMPVVRVAFFRSENGKAVLAKEFVVRNADGSYPSWRSVDQDGFTSGFDP
jgi:hypothetical protein